MSKYNKWWDSLPQSYKEYLKKQPTWHDSDLWRAGIIGSIIGFVVGVMVGFEWAWRPVVDCFRPLVG